MAQAQGLLTGPRASLALFALALAVRGVYLLAIYSGPDSLMHVDSAMWLRLAENPANWLGNEERMPFYPLYLGLVGRIFGPEPIHAVIGQIVADAAACVLIARSAAALAGRGGERAGWIAGLAAAFNPTQVVMASVVLGDSLFLFFIAGTIHAALRWLDDLRFATAMELGLWAGMAFLNRAFILPVLAALPPVLAAIAVLRGRGTAPALRQAAVVAFLAVLCIGSAVLRNWVEHGVPAITSQTGFHMAFWVVPLVQEAKDGTPVAQTQSEIAAAFWNDIKPADLDGPFAISDRWAAAARARMAGLGAAAFAKAWATGAAINLASPAVLMSPPLMQLPRTGFYATPGAGIAEKIANFLWSNDNAAYARWMLAGALVEFPLKLLAFLGMLVGLATAGTRLATAALVGWIVFVLLVNGPVASPKYRLPIEPVACIFIGLAAARFGKRYVRA
ncbi:MAG: glycosyltransferase family 39 protein [Proteobacteria bacterium]|nr:glycosyltransferase family 39 protein [Pseudomonadota bacterium]